MRLRSSFPYGTTHEDVRVTLPDSTRLYARVWRPLTDEPVPALLEYEPGRLTDATAPRDTQRHPWYAGHGYASVRVDARGHGNSEGVPGPAHDTAGPADGTAVVDWLARQPWCTGRVGMFGIGAGGSAALRVAALAPEPLRAVVAVCATDDPYDTGVHYLGGAVMAAGLHAASAARLARAARPPDPVYAGELWREMWLARLETLDPPARTWLAHPTRDTYRRGARGPVDLGAVRAAVLAVGGLHDPYRDAVLRLVERLPRERVRGIIGPWAHRYPDQDLPPGPAIGFLQETLRWWDHHLKGLDNGVMDEPLLRSWIGSSRPPATAYRELPGRWAAEDAWPSPHVAPVAYALQGSPVPVRSPLRTGLDAGRVVPSGNDADLPPDQRAEDAYAACFDFPVPEDGPPLEILGRPRVTLALHPLDLHPLDLRPLTRPGSPGTAATTAPPPRPGPSTAPPVPVAPGTEADEAAEVNEAAEVDEADAPDRPASSTAPPEPAASTEPTDADADADGDGDGDAPSPPDAPGPSSPPGPPDAPGPPAGQVVVRICDVAPGGASTLVTRGALALSPGRTVHTVELNATGHAFRPGHHVRLAVSSAYWPWLWPLPDAPGFTLDPAGSSLALPLRAPAPAGRGRDGAVRFEPPEQAEPLGANHPATLDEAQRPALLLVRDVARGEWRLEADVPGSGLRIHPDGLEFTEDAVETYTVTESDPLSARARSEWHIRLHRPDLFWNVTVDTRSEIACEAGHFLTTDEVICAAGTEVLFHRTWHDRIPRTAG
ncbi:CocE/NonD family hydrolase [Streptomyces sp. NRRL S-118]|uniref:CocE/NonD family hydrolase n=1 Tax=Streptomyces sp. NRRL S-118 TaxID=1463881 RepID=UPI0004C5B0A2|nr:CocE/NonD family hydrolase [Streptomyces sp. NRRL S-118]